MVGLHLRFRRTRETDVGGTGVRAVPDHDALPERGQHFGELPDSGRFLREAAARRDHPRRAVADDLVRDRRAVDLDRRHERALYARLPAMAAADLPLVAHWIDGKRVEGSSERRGDVFDPTTGQVSKLVAFASPGDVDAAVDAAAAAFTSWRWSSLAERTKIVFRFRELLDQRADALAAIITAEHGKVLADALRRSRTRVGSRRVRVRDGADAEGRLLAGRIGTRRRGVDASAARRRRDHQPVQLPGDGAVLVLSDCDRGRQHGHPQAEREGPVGRELDRRVVGRSRAAGRRLQRRARRQRCSRRAARTPRHQGRVVRRLDSGRAARLRNRDAAREARAGIGRREEPHDRVARRRSRPRGRRRGQRRIRFRRGTVHGHLRCRRGRRCRRRARRQDRRRASAGCRSAGATPTWARSSRARIWSG